MAKNPGAKDSKGRYLDPAAAINAGLMKKKSGEIVSPGKIVAKVAAKVAGRGLAQAAKNASKIVGKDVSKPGTLEKLSQGMTQAEKAALANKLKKANVAGKKGVGIAGKQAKDGIIKPIKTKDLGPSARELKLLNIAELEKKHNKALAAARKAGVTGKVTTAHNGSSVTSTI
jgi:hypothetical protein